MSFKRINKTKYPMVDELGRLMNREMQLIQPQVDPETKRRYFFTPPEEKGGSDPVRRDLAVEVYRHHSPDAPAATVDVDPDTIVFKDENPGNCNINNLMVVPVESGGAEPTDLQAGTEDIPETDPPADGAGDDLVVDDGSEDQNNKVAEVQEKFNALFDDESDDEDAPKKEFADLWMDDEPDHDNQLKSTEAVVDSEVINDKLPIDFVERIYDQTTPIEDQAKANEPVSDAAVINDQEPATAGATKDSIVEAEKLSETKAKVADKQPAETESVSSAESEVKQAPPTKAVKTTPKSKAKATLKKHPSAKKK